MKMKSFQLYFTGDAFSNPDTQKLLSDLHNMMIKILVAMETKDVNVCNFKQPQVLEVS